MRLRRFWAGRFSSSLARLRRFCSAAFYCCSCSFQQSQEFHPECSRKPFSGSPSECELTYKAARTAEEHWRCLREGSGNQVVLYMDGAARYLFQVSDEACINAEGCFLMAPLIAYHVIGICAAAVDFFSVALKLGLEISSRLRSASCRFAAYSKSVPNLPRLSDDAYGSRSFC